MGFVREGRQLFVREGRQGLLGRVDKVCYGE